MPPKKDQRFGRVVVKEYYPARKNDGIRSQVLCVCDCGKEFTTRADSLGSSTNSCGCLHREKTVARLQKQNKEKAKYQGFSARFPRTWKVWESMLDRCYRKKSTAYPDYGGKGVVVCQYLRESPWNFKEFMGKKPKGKKSSIDRFPIHNGNYCCGQCEECKENGWSKNLRWASRKEQSLNRGSFNVYFTAFGLTLTRSQWAEVSGIDSECVRARLERGWTFERAITTPDKHGNFYDPQSGTTIQV